MRDYQLTNAMLFEEDRWEMDATVLVESKNTGRQWRMNLHEVDSFFSGRRREWYRVFNRVG